MRAGPYNTVRFSRDTCDEKGRARWAIQRSDDGGNSWRRRNGGLPAAPAHMICGFATHPDDRDTVCVGYTDGSIYASRDAGESWRQLEVSQPKLYGLRLIAAG